jgi:hypothetical protein
MQLGKALAFAAVVCLAAPLRASADVHITIQDGRVSLDAKDATLRQILAEWARVGQTRIVNAERVPGGPLTIKFTNVPEEQALDMVLRSLTGYVAAPRQTVAANLSRFDRIVVVPTIVQPPAPAAAAAAVPTPAAYQQPTFQTPFPPNGPVQPIPGVADDQEDDRPAQRGPVFNTFPPPQVVTPQPQTYPTTVPGVMPPAQQNPYVMPQPANGVYQNGAQPQVAPYPGAPTTPPGAAQPGMITTQPGQQPQPKRPNPGGE